MSIQPSTVYGAPPSGGWTVTKPPELSETSPTSLTIVDQRGGERGVDRVAAGPGDLLAGVGGGLVGGGDRDVGHVRTLAGGSPRVRAGRS